MTKWPMVSLGEVMELDMKPTPVHADQEYPNFGIYSFGRGLFSKPPISGATTSATNLYQVRAGQFVYSRLFAFEGAYGLVGEEFDGYFISNEYPHFDCDPKRLSSAYLATYFRWRKAWEQAATLSTGMGDRRRRIQPEQLLRMTVPLPSVREQQRLVLHINDLSGRIQEAIRLRNEADKEVAALEASWANAFFQNAQAVWPVLPLGEISEIRAGVTLGRSLSGPTIRRPYLRVANVQDGRLDLTVMKEVEILHDESEKWNLVAGDVLLTEGGDRDKLGRGTVWQGEIADCIHQNHIFRVRVDRSVLIPEFLSFQTASPYGREYFQSASKQTTNLASINQRQLKSFPVMTPPVNGGEKSWRWAVEKCGAQEWRIGC